MMPSPLVSVCIPTVDRLHFLRETVASVANQTLQDVEILIAENSGDSAYKRAVDAMVGEFPDAPIRVVHHPRQIRMVDNANYLVDAARGKYWLYLPDDDRLRPTCLEELVRPLERHATAALAWSDHWMMDADGRVNVQATDDTSRRFGRSSLAEGLIGHQQLTGVALRQSLAIQCILFRAETIRRYRFDTELEPVLDFDLELRLASDPDVSAYYVSSRLVEYRVHGAQTTAAPVDPRVGTAMIAALERFRPTNPEDERYRRQQIARYQRALAVALAARGDHARARALAWQAARADPTLRGVAGLIMAVLPAPVVGAVRGALASFRTSRG